MSQSTLEVKGIGPASSVVLAEHGFKSAKDLAQTTSKKLAAVPGFGYIRAAQIITDAKTLIAKPAKSTKPSKKKDKKNSKPKKSDQKVKKTKTSKQKSKSTKDKSKDKLKGKNKEKVKNGKKKSKKKSKK